MSNSQNYIKQSNRLGIFFVLLFIICFLWYFIMPVERDLHLRLLKMSFFGFNKFDFIGFILGAVQSYIWAYIFVGLWYLTKKISE